ncbi:helix-turn-helix domain-containing protein [Solobacterium moorei]
MLNKFPEKLTLLRKHYGLSQGDVATKINVKFTDYMNWENGNSIPSISNIRKLSVLFGVPVESFIDNRKVIELPEVKVVPQVQPQPQQPTTEQKPDETVKADTVHTQRVNSVKNDLGSTRVMDAGKIKTAAKVAEPKEPKKENGQKKRKKISYAIMAGCLVAVVVVIAIILRFTTGGKSGFTVETSELNRIAEGDTYTLFINKNNSLEVYGDFQYKNEFQDVVQVSAYGSHAVGLKKDGTVVTTDKNEEVAKWKNIKAVAAGKDHTVGLTNDGKVVCAGSELACQVSDWSDVDSIYAGDDATFAIINGQVKVSGNSANFSSISDAKKLAVGESQVLVLKKDGSVSAVSLKGSSTSDVSSWTKISSIAVGKNYVVGVHEDGTVSVVSDDKDLKEAVGAWTDVKYIAAYDDTLVAFNRSGKMYGYGDNSSSQYENSFKTDAKQLSQVKNITFTVTTANVNIAWDPVENADYYELTVNTNPITEHKNIISNSDSIASSSLKDGETYVVTITAHSKKEDKYKTSEKTSINFAYNAKTVQLNSPTDITATGLQNAWHFAWSPVENADKYNISIDGTVAASNVEGTSITIDGISFAEGSEHEISITALSSNPAYTESVPTKAKMKYTISKGKIKINFEKPDGSSAGSKTYELNVGSYYAQNIIKPSDIPSGFKLADEQTTAEVMNGQTTEVTVRLQAN